MEEAEEKWSLNENCKCNQTLFFHLSTVASFDRLCHHFCRMMIQLLWTRISKFSTKLIQHFRKLSSVKLFLIQWRENKRGPPKKNWEKQVTYSYVIIWHTLLPVKSCALWLAQPRTQALFCAPSWLAETLLLSVVTFPFENLANFVWYSEFRNFHCCCSYLDV